MPSRRSILAAAVATVGAGCSNRREGNVNPADHVPDDWHDEPQRALADPFVMSSGKLSQHPPSDCPRLAAETVNEVIDERLDYPETVSGGGCCRDVAGHDRAILVHRFVTVARDGEVVSSPNFEFQTVREAVPRTVKAPDDSDHDCQHPVYVVDSMSQAD